MTTRQQVIDLALQNTPPRDIAVMLNRTRATVYHYLFLARRAGVNIPEFRGGARITTAGYMHISNDTAALLRPHAARRGIPPRDLARRILETVAGNDLVDAVLDDGGHDD